MLKEQTLLRGVSWLQMGVYTNTTGPQLAEIKCYFIDVCFLSFLCIKGKKKKEKPDLFRMWLRLMREVAIRKQNYALEKEVGISIV